MHNEMLLFRKIVLCYIYFECYLYIIECIDSYKADIILFPNVN